MQKLTRAVPAIELPMILAMLSPPALPDDGAAGAVPSPAAGVATLTDPQELVSLLGAPDFATRLAATRRLIEIGPTAEPALVAGLSTGSPEVIFRCRHILSEIEYKERFGRLEAFAADLDGKQGLTLPGWERYRSLVGSDSKARRLFVSMHKSEPYLLEKVEKEPKAVADTLVQRVQVMQQSMRFPNAAIDTGSMATLLFLISDPEMKVADNATMMMYSLCNYHTFRQEMERGAHKAQLRSLLGEFVKMGGNQTTAYYRLMLALQYELKEGGVAARNLLEDPRAPQHYKQYAVLTIAKLNDKDSLELIRKLLSDRTVCTSHTMMRNNKRVVYQTQLRDVALSALIHMNGEDPKKFGFERISPNLRYLFNPGTMGFTDDKARDEAFKKWEVFETKKAREEAAQAEAEAAQTAEEIDEDLEAAPQAEDAEKPVPKLEVQRP